jgi:hypothetical protein
LYANQFFMRSAFILLLLTILGLVKIGHAQDKILLKNGSELKVLVLELNPEMIKYKRFENSSGPTYSIPNKDVVRVIYENGQTEEIASVAKRINDVPPDTKLRYGGPRIGVTYLGAGQSTARMNDLFNRNINPVITQFGWQFETRFFTLENGASGLVELVPMFGGLEQGLFIPSITGLVGFRTAKGYELGLGPTLSLGGSGILFAAGASLRSGKIVFPVNIAFIPSVTKSYQEEKTETQIYNPSTGFYELQTQIKPAYKEHTGFRITLTIGFNSRSK